MTGDLVYLTALIPEDAQAITGWLNDPEITQYLAEHREIKSLELVKEDVNKRIETGAAFAIFDVKTDTLIGYCVLDDDHLDILIGEKAYRAGGYGVEAMGLLMDFGYTYKNCGNILVSAYSHDARSIACFEAAGFKKTLVKRERLLRGREKYDLIYFDMLASEYFGRGKRNA